MSEAGDVLRVDHLTMRFGGLVAVHDLSFSARHGEITALIGPNGAGKTTVFNCITGFYKPTEGRIALQSGDPSAWQRLDRLTASSVRSHSRRGGSLFLLERMPDHLVAKQARVARTFQNIRLFRGMTVLENLLVAQHNPLMLRVGFFRIRHSGVAALHACRRQGDRQRRALARYHRAHGSRRRSGRRSAIRRSAAARNRARHVHRSGAALSRRAGGGSEPARER